MTAAESVLHWCRADMVPLHDMTKVRERAQMHGCFDAAGTAQARALGLSVEDDLQLFSDGSMLLLGDNWTGTLGKVCPILDYREAGRSGRSRNLTYSSRRGRWLVMEFDASRLVTQWPSVKRLYRTDGALDSEWPTLSL